MYRFTCHAYVNILKTDYEQLRSVQINTLIKDINHNSGQGEIDSDSIIGNDNSMSIAEGEVYMPSTMTSASDALKTTSVFTFKVKTANVQVSSQIEIGLSKIQSLSSTELGIIQFSDVNYPRLDRCYYLIEKLA